MIDGIKIVGGHGERRAFDFYPTPPECTKALLKYLNLKPGTMVWEPAAGDGSMARVLTEHGCRVISTDIQTGTDFLTAALPDEKIEWIITNPPFNKCRGVYPALRRTGTALRPAAESAILAQRKAETAVR